MHTKNFVNYIEFLQYAKEHEKEIKNIKYYDGRLYSFNTCNARCKYICEVEAITPTKFVKMLGFDNYNAFTYKRFSHIRDYTQDDYDVLKWYSGYFGGLIGVNIDKINDYCGDGVINRFYDYDLNKAYLHALTGWLPTKFIKTIYFNEFMEINDIDKLNYCFFFEIKVPKHKGHFLSVLGDIRSTYKSFDFINSKQNETMIVSELRLKLIDQIYFTNYTIEKIYVFEKRRFKFFRNILNSYCEKKENYGESFKRNALRLYGSFGQIYKTVPKKLYFEKSGQLKVDYDKIVNEKSSPQVAMWVADTVATKLFDIISKNLDDVVSWNTDGFTSIKPIKVQIDKQPGKWKYKTITGTPFLFDDNSCRVFYKDVEKNKIFGGDTIEEKDGFFEFSQEFKFSSLKKGYVSKFVKAKILPNTKFNNLRTFRSVVLIERIKELRKEYEEF